MQISVLGFGHKWGERSLLWSVYDSRSPKFHAFYLGLTIISTSFITVITTSTMSSSSMLTTRPTWRLLLLQG